MARNSELLDLYSSLRRQLALEANAFLKDFGFSLRQFLILRNLGHQGRTTMTSLAALCMTDAATISRAVEQLVREQFVRKARCREDGRVWWAELTAKGTRLLPELDRRHAALADQCFSNLTNDEKRALAHTLQKVVNSLRGQRGEGRSGENA